MKLLRNSVLFISLLASLPSVALDRIGNGGHGVRVNGKLYLLDLYEFGVEQSPYFKSQVQIDPDIERFLVKALAKIQLPSSLVKKMNEIAAFDTLLMTELLQSFRLYKFRFVNYRLPLTDEDTTLPQNISIEQLALRQGPVIFISKPHWDQLDDANRAALLLHEAIYGHLAQGAKSYLARRITGALFDPDLATDKLYYGSFADLPYGAGYGNQFRIQQNWSVTSIYLMLKVGDCKLDPRESYHCPMFPMPVAPTKLGVDYVMQSWDSHQSYVENELKLGKQVEIRIVGRARVDRIEVSNEGSTIKAKTFPNYWNLITLSLSQADCQVSGNSAFNCAAAIKEHVKEALDLWEKRHQYID